MEWYWILLITIGSIIVYILLVFPLWVILRAASIQSRYEEEHLIENNNEEELSSKGDK